MTTPTTADVNTRTGTDLVALATVEQAPPAAPRRSFRSRHPRPTRLLLLLLVCALAGAGVLGIAPEQASAAVTRPLVYKVTIRGTASGNPFRIAGVLVVARTVTRVTGNGVNPLDACLAAGFPAGNPRAGAIRYGTNSACFSSRGAHVDTAFVRVRGTVIRTRPDGRLQATFLNNWTAVTSIVACIYSPVSGATRYHLSRKSVRGAISMRGYGGAFCGYSTYTATISGTRVQ